MAAYPNTTGAGIGTLLRMIKEEKANSPVVAVGDEPGSAIRETVQQPYYNPESVGSERVVSLRPEDVKAPAAKEEEIAPQATSVGPKAIGGEQIGQAPAPTQGVELPGKQDINPETGKQFAVNPDTGVWDDNYWANTIEPRLREGWVPTPPEARGPELPGKSEINPDTGLPFAVNPDTGLWDDNYYAQFAEPMMLQYGTTKPEKQQKPMEQLEPVAAPGLGTKISTAPPAQFERWIAPPTEAPGEILGSAVGGTRDYYGPTYEEAAQAIAANEAAAQAKSQQEIKEMPKVPNSNASNEEIDQYLRDVNLWERKYAIPGKPTPTLYPTGTPTPTSTPMPLPTKIR